MALFANEKTFFESLIENRHPLFQRNREDWENWRSAYEGGEEFLDDFLKRFSKRESKKAFDDRKAITPVAGYAQTAIDRIRNAIFQRMGDIVRRDGSKKYMESVAGEKSGVDRRGSNMNFFMGKQVLTELLVMGKYGVFVDMPKESGPTLADSIKAKPYLYGYRVEDILSWTNSNPEDPNEFQALLLRDVDLSVDEDTFLPEGATLRFRWVFINPRTGRVNVQFISKDGKPGEKRELELTRIPFHVFDIGGSLMKNIWRHQVALLNTDSANVSYNILSNYPFLTEKRDSNFAGRHLKPKANADGTATEGGQGANEETVEIGNMTARTYLDKPPQFIAPPGEPLEVSLQLRERLIEDIDRLVSLKISTLGENEGLESGLAFVANNMQTGEMRLADFWSLYEERKESSRKIATIKYPDRYSLKSDEERINDSNKLGELMSKVPGRTIKKELAKTIVSTLLSGKVNTEMMDTINKEIEEAPYCTSDPATIEMAIDKGLASPETGSLALGFMPGEAEKAQKARAERIALTKEAQTAGNPAARGIDDEAASPREEASEEKEASRETDEEETTKSRIRGKAQ